MDIDYQSLFEFIPGLYLILSPDLKILSASDEYLKAVFMEKDEILGQNLLEVFSPNFSESASALKASLDYVLQHKTAHTVPAQKYTVRNQAGSFEEKYLVLLNKPGLNSQKEIQYIILSCRDITGQKKAEEELKKRNEDLEQTVIERSSQLDSVNKELEAFTYSVSHDLRAPLRAINGYAKILQEDYAETLDNDGLSSLKAILNNSKRMGELIDDLLAFSRLSRTAGTPSEINMTGLVKTVMEEEITENLRKIEYNPKELLPAKGEQMLVKQVWVNLISNALKYSKNKPTPKIEIGSYYKDKHVVYYVKDNGAGFDMLYYDKLFGVFQRLHSQEEFEGTGIGLAIVQKIVQRQNGDVWAESRVNEGSCFYFSLPNINF